MSTALASASIYATRRYATLRQLTISDVLLGNAASASESRRPGAGESFTGLPGLDRASQTLSPSLLIDSRPVRQRHTGNRQTPTFRISRVCFGQQPTDSPVNQPDAHGLTAVGVGNRQWSMQPQQTQRQDEKGGGWPAARRREMLVVETGKVLFLCHPPG
ncbi:hypothetical protein CMUS01_06154 [Colletotrichum musicola]|uniref:Uncharacterized protein n=1 Tax=Colletotrichum musicola TaxID=2175873 RepID=A0A8H6KMW8_9PEZI|nr:hypothetical protein CMUS01_06154 [Colletotrichum musicola]